MTEYSNPRCEAVINDWPIGNKRTTATFVIEADPKRGERGTRFTIDPKTGRPSAPKKLTYAKRARIVDGDDGRTYIAELSIYGIVSIANGDMKYYHESFNCYDPRYNAMLALLSID